MTPADWSQKHEMLVNNWSENSSMIPVFEQLEGQNGKDALYRSFTQNTPLSKYKYNYNK